MMIEVRSGLLSISTYLLRHAIDKLLKILYNLFGIISYNIQENAHVRTNLIHLRSAKRTYSPTGTI